MAEVEVDQVEEALVLVLVLAQVEEDQVEVAEVAEVVEVAEVAEVAEVDQVEVALVQGEGEGGDRGGGNITD